MDSAITVGKQFSFIFDVWDALDWERDNEQGNESDDELVDDDDDDDDDEQYEDNDSLSSFT